MESADPVYRRRGIIRQAIREATATSETVYFVLFRGDFGRFGLDCHLSRSGLLRRFHDTLVDLDFLMDYCNNQMTGGEFGSGGAGFIYVRVRGLARSSSFIIGCCRTSKLEDLGKDRLPLAWGGPCDGG
jgi:hypothetical protein